MVRCVDICQTKSVALMTGAIKYDHQYKTCKSVFRNFNRKQPPNQKFHMIQCSTTPKYNDCIL